MLVAAIVTLSGWTVEEVGCLIVLMRDLAPALIYYTQ
jgi:hypothetical protein